MNHMLLKDGSYAQGYFLPEGAVFIDSARPSIAHKWEVDKWVFKGFSDDYTMSAFRTRRNRLLAETDWMASSDVTMSVAWKTYRQKLRDLPSTASPELNEKEEIINVTWPTKPS